MISSSRNQENVLLPTSNLVQQQQPPYPRDDEGSGPTTWQPGLGMGQATAHVADTYRTQVDQGVPHHEFRHLGAGLPDRYAPLQGSEYSDYTSIDQTNHSSLSSAASWHFRPQQQWPTSSEAEDVSSSLAHLHTENQVPPIIYQHSMSRPLLDPFPAVSRHSGHLSESAARHHYANPPVFSQPFDLRVSTHTSEELPQQSSYHVSHHNPLIPGPQSTMSVLPYTTPHTRSPGYSYHRPPTPAENHLRQHQWSYAGSLSYSSSLQHEDDWTRLDAQLFRDVCDS